MGLVKGDTVILLTTQIWDESDLQEAPEFGETQMSRTETARLLCILRDELS